MNSDVPEMSSAGSRPNEFIQIDYQQRQNRTQSTRNDHKEDKNVYETNINAYMNILNTTCI